MNIYTPTHACLYMYALSVYYTFFTDRVVNKSEDHGLGPLAHSPGDESSAYLPLSPDKCPIP